MENKEVLERVRQYNQNLSLRACTQIEKSYIEQMNQNYFYNFSFTLTNLPHDVEAFLHGQKYFKGLLQENHDKLCLYLRHIQEYTCNSSLIRMDVRSNNFAHYSDKIVRAIGAFYLFYGAKMDLKDLIYGSYRQLFYSFDFAPVITVELLQENEDVIKWCQDVLMSENNTAILSRDVIVAIEQSHHQGLQALLMKVFLAAKLQEGLRQSVIETVDEHNFTYFLEMLEVIKNEDLLRFVSIQRGVLTWIGIGYEEVKEKDVRYIFEHLYEYFRHETIRQSARLSTNPLNAYLALYCKGAVSLEAALLEASELLQSSSRHLVACGLVYLKLTRCFEVKQYAYFMDTYKGDEWIMALYYSECSRHQIKELDLSQEEAVNLFWHILAFVETMKSRQTYRCKGFEWFVLSLNKYQLCLTLFQIIKEYPLPDLIDAYLPYVANTLNDKDLDYFMSGCFVKGSNEAKMAFMIKEIISNNDTLSRAIVQELSKRPLTETEMKALEERLKTKKGKARGYIVNVLAHQSKPMVIASYQRLLTSSLKTVRESALEMKKKKPEYFDELEVSEINMVGKDDGYGLYSRFTSQELVYPSRLLIKTTGLIKKKTKISLAWLLPWDKDQVLTYLEKWQKRIIVHEDDEYYNGYEYRQVKDPSFWPLDRQKSSLEAVPLSEIWRDYFDEDKLTADVVFELAYLLATLEDEVDIVDYLGVNTDLFTLTKTSLPQFTYYKHFSLIVSYYLKEFDCLEFVEKARTYLELLAKYPLKSSYHKYDYNHNLQSIPLSYLQSSLLMISQLHLEDHDDEQFKQSFMILYELYKTFNLNIADDVLHKMTIMPHHLARAVAIKLISKEALYEGILDTHCQNEHRYVYSRNDNLLFEAYRDAYYQGRGWSGKPNLSLEDYHHQYYYCSQAILIVLRQALDTISQKLIEMETTRLNEVTPVTAYVEQLKVIRGVKYLILALRVLEGEELKRQTYGDDRNTVFTNVIRHCYPLVSDQVETLSDANFSEARLVAVAMLAPQWIDFINQVLKWDGFKEACYYFIAHMKQDDYDQKKAAIAKYTHLDPLDLNDGAIDLDWCKKVYAQLGEKRFKVIYQAAKFLCDNSYHSRARKYADACLGKVTKEELLKQVIDKRNKDALNAYCICPLDDDCDLLTRYQVIQQFLKESRQFGTQRQISEKRAGEIALLNLARNSKYETPIRLLWMMESEMFALNAHLLKPQSFGNVEMWLEIDEQGKNHIVVSKQNKRQKSIPAAIRKDKQVLELKAISKQWNELQQRCKAMLEQAMAERTSFGIDEITAMINNPIVAGMLSKLVLMNQNNCGFYDQGNLKTLTSSIKITGAIAIAHPFDLYQKGCWSAYQKLLFEQKIVQPFKQVFRELYVKLDDELDQSISKRYTGYQIQTKKTVALLKKRNWNVSYEMGLERVYYHDDLIVNLFSQADWFSPSDIEAPSIDYVQFTSRKSGEPRSIKEIDEIVFSETMRDLDLAVSLSYVGGVDPITSSATMELRQTIVKYTCDLMKLTNVLVQDHFVNIKGTINDYSVHLGSGTIHQSGGGTINMVTVLNGKRGKIYLPFLDEDPKTAEIISKIIMLAEDQRIKDPSILKQICSRKLEV